MLSISPTHVIDVSEAEVSRDAVNLRMAQLIQMDDTFAYSFIDFDFLDYRDSALVKVVTDQQSAIVRLAGTVIGMPQGIQPIYKLSKHRVLGWIAVIILGTSAIAGAENVFVRFGGQWSSLLPLIPALVVLLLLILIITTAWFLLWPKGPKWPKEPALPDWFIRDTLIPRPPLYDSHYYPYEQERNELNQTFADMTKRKKGKKVE